MRGAKEHDETNRKEDRSTRVTVSQSTLKTKTKTKQSKLNQKQVQKTGKPSAIMQVTNTFDVVRSVWERGGDETVASGRMW